MLTSKLRQIIFCSLFIGASIGISAAPAAQVQSDEEAFLIRRIAEFWKDGDYAIVKTQILDFFDKYPNSGLKDYFLGILGDIYLQENKYQDALYCYQQIKNGGIVEKIILNKLQCYYECDQYGALVKEGKPFIKKSVEGIKGREQEFYFLLGEGCFRQALIEKNPDAKRNLALEAKGFYDKLQGGHYAEISEFALAEIHATLGQYEKGASLYLSLAEKHPEMKEDLLFQAAALQSEYNREEAISTFNQVKELGGNKAKDAAFNLVVLLFQKGDYSQIISTYEKLAPSIPETHQPTFDFIVGKSFFSKGEYDHALQPLGRFIESQYLPNDQLKNALLIQMTCAHQTKNEHLFNEAFEKLNSLFPSDPELPKALFMHAMMLKEQGAISRANEKLQLIKEKYKDFEDQESFLFECGLLSHQNEHWQESYQTFKEFVKCFPKSKRIDAAWKLFLSSSLNLYKRSSEKSEYGKRAFFKDLQLILNQPDFLNDDEMKDYSLLYAKIAYELESYVEGLRVLQDYLFTHVSEESDPFALAEAHFIAGLCHGELKGDYSAFCMHLEQAMLLSPETYNNATTHLQLFNAYISLAGFGEKGEMAASPEHYQEFVNHAAEHLQEAINQGDPTIKKENRLWLANHYFQTVKSYFDEHWSHKSADHPEIAKAIECTSELYESLLTENGRFITLKMENLYLETEFLKFAKLLEYKGQNEKKLALLKNLIDQQGMAPTLNWTSQKQALFELAAVYKDLGDMHNAYETYEFIQSSSGHFPTAMANAAILESSRLHFNLLDKHEKNESNQEVLSILNQLKELQIRKHAASEPTHLEAGLEYAKIRSELGDPAQRDSRYLFFLKRIQDDFTSKEDLITKDYLANLKKNSNKQQIFDSYMKFIDAEKLRLEAKQLFEQMRLNEMEELNESALSVYNEIKNHPATPRDLYKRTMQSIEEINSLNAY